MVNGAVAESIESLDKVSNSIDSKTTYSLTLDENSESDIVKDIGSRANEGNG